MYLVATLLDDTEIKATGWMSSSCFHLIHSFGHWRKLLDPKR